MLDEHPVVKSQVFKHDGRTPGQAAVVTAAEAVVTVVDEITAVVETAYVVENVEVLVTRIVDVEELVWISMLVVPADVWVKVAVTGQIVVVSSTTTVVMTSTAEAEVGVVTTPAALLVERTGEEVWVSVTGQTVVETATETVVTEIDLAGQLTTSVGQL